MRGQREYCIFHFVFVNIKCLSMIIKDKIFILLLFLFVYKESKLEVKLHMCVSTLELNPPHKLETDPRFRVTVLWLIRLVLALARY